MSSKGKQSNLQFGEEGVFDPQSGSYESLNSQPGEYESSYDTQLGTSNSPPWTPLLPTILELSDEKEIENKLLDFYMWKFYNAGHAVSRENSYPCPAYPCPPGDDYWNPVAPEQSYNYMESGNGDFGILCVGQSGIISDLMFAVAREEKCTERVEKFLQHASKDALTTLIFIPHIKAKEEKIRPYFTASQIIGSLIPSLEDVRSLATLTNIQTHLSILKCLRKFVANNRELEFRVLPVLSSPRTGYFACRKTTRSGWSVSGIWHKRKGFEPAELRTFYGGNQSNRSDFLGLPRIWWTE